MLGTPLTLTITQTCEKTSCCRLEIVSALLTVSMAVSFILVSFMAL